MGQAAGGSFSINEHGQVIARTKAPAGQGNTMHVVNISGGVVAAYTTPIVFQQGQLSPVARRRRVAMARAIVRNDLQIRRPGESETTVAQPR